MKTKFTTFSNVPIDVLINDIIESNEDFKDDVEHESAKWAMSTLLCDTIDIDDNSDEQEVYEFPKGKEFMLIDSYYEKGDGKDESTVYGLFVRLSDDKKFEIWVHDYGFIGPSSLVMSEYLEGDKTKWIGKYKNKNGYKDW